MPRKVEFIESYIKVGNDYQWNDNHGELIRCNDCKNYSIAKNGVNGFCNKLSVPFDANEWCSKADAKKED